jgi:hypothetical protein
MHSFRTAPVGSASRWLSTKKLATAPALVAALLASGATAAQAGTVVTKTALLAALQQAEAAGRVESVEAVGASQQTVEAAFNPGERELTSSMNPPARPPASLALLVMRGSFEDVFAKVPRGAPFPTGTVMSFVVNLGTGSVAALSVKDTAPVIPSGATVERPQVTASMQAHSASVRRWAARVRSQLAGSRADRRRRAHAATWGNDCKPSPSYDHCYVVAQWDMKGAEQVYGGDTEQRTSHIEVPGWEKGYFVDNEMWSWNHEKGDGTWTEIGQQAGEGKGCCNTWWFYAFQNPVEKYNQYVGPPYVSEVPEEVGMHYAMKWAGGSNIWCWYYGATLTNPETFELKACANYFYQGATQLEAGGEIATESKPSFASAANNSAQWTNDTWHTWNFASMVVTTPGLCYSSLNGAPGNIYYDTCSGDMET